MTDRELLELAAKASNINYSIGFNVETGEPWDPLTDDGDALRLAVKLGICIDFNFADTLGEVSAAQILQPYQYESMTDDPYAATRRAIVRAAAEIGKEIK